MSTRKIRFVGAAALVLPFCLGAISTPANASSSGTPQPPSRQTLITTMKKNSCTVKTNKISSSGGKIYVYGVVHCTKKSTLKIEVALYRAHKTLGYWSRILDDKAGPIRGKTLGLTAEKRCTRGKTFEYKSGVFAYSGRGAGQAGDRRWVTCR